MSTKIRNNINPEIISCPDEVIELPDGFHDRCLGPLKCFETFYSGRREEKNEWTYKIERKKI